MARMFVVKDDATLEVLKGSLLSARLSNTQATSALAELQTLNPHVDLKNVSAGTVLLVPDAPSFKASASDSVVGDAFGGFQELVRDELTAVARNLRTGAAARAEQRSEVASVQKTAAFRKVVEQDAELKEQLAQASKQAKDDEKAAAAAEDTVEAVSKGAMAELAALAKLLG